MAAVNFELVSPEKLLLSEAVEMVLIPGSEGDFGVLPGHAPMISSLRPGVICIFENGKVGKRLFVAGGFAEVTPQRCTILAEKALPLEDMVVADLTALLQKTEKELSEMQDNHKRAQVAKTRDVIQAQIQAVTKPSYGS